MPPACRSIRVLTSGLAQTVLPFCTGLPIAASLGHSCLSQDLMGSSSQHILESHIKAIPGTVLFVPWQSMQPCSHQRLQIQFSLRCAHANTFCLASQGEDTDEVQNQPAWLREDAQDEHPPAENGGPPSLGDLSLHQRNSSTGAADFVGLGGAEEPYANGDSHAQPGRPSRHSPAPKERCAGAVRLAEWASMQKDGTWRHIHQTCAYFCRLALSVKRARPLACVNTLYLAPH